MQHRFMARRFRARGRSTVLSSHQWLFARYRDTCEETTRNRLSLERDAPPSFFQANGDHASALIKIGESHTEDAVSSCAIFPIANSLSGAQETAEDGFVTPRTRSLDQSSRCGWIDRRRD